MEPVVDLDEFYRTYGEQLASRVALIAHSDENPAFLFLEDAGDPKDVQDLISSGRLTTRFMIWENFQEDIDNGGRDNYHSAVVGSMMIMQKGVNKAGKHQARRECRAALLKAFALMLQDSLQGVLADNYIQLDVRDLPCESMVGMLKDYHGYGMQFRWTVPIDLDLVAGDVLDA